MRQQNTFSKKPDWKIRWPWCRSLKSPGRWLYRDGGTGSVLGHHDVEYTEPDRVGVGGDVLNCDVVVGLHFPSDDQLRPGTILVCVGDPFRHPSGFKLLHQPITLLARRDPASLTAGDG